jgi:hypothetical protein
MLRRRIGYVGQKTTLSGHTRLRQHDDRCHGTAAIRAVMSAALYPAEVRVARKSGPSRLVQQDLRAPMPQLIDLCQSFPGCNQ